MRFLSAIALAAIGLAPGCTSSASPVSPQDQAVSAEGSGPIRLGQLQPGDRLEVDAHWWGCFHDDRWHFVVEQGAGPTPGISGTQINGYSRFRDPDADDPQRFAHRSLTTTEVAGLDVFLDDLRSTSRPGICTSQADYQLRWYRGGTIVMEESFDRVSCEGREGIVYLHQLIPD